MKNDLDLICKHIHVYNWLVYISELYGGDKGKKTYNQMRKLQDIIEESIDVWWKSEFKENHVK